MLQVDKHIRRLDADLARFEAELKEKPPGTSSGKLKTQKDGKAIKDKPSKDKAGETYCKTVFDIEIYFILACDNIQCEPVS